MSLGFIPFGWRDGGFQVCLKGRRQVVVCCGLKTKSPSETVSVRKDERRHVNLCVLKRYKRVGRGVQSWWSLSYSLIVLETRVYLFPWSPVRQLTYTEWFTQGLG